MDYSKECKYAVEANRTCDALNGNDCVLTDTAFNNVDAAKLFAKLLSKYTGVAVVLNQMTKRIIAKYDTGRLIK